MVTKCVTTQVQRPGHVTCTLPLVHHRTIADTQPPLDPNGARLGPKVSLQKQGRLTLLRIHD
jgi:hypothetical protein